MQNREKKWIKYPPGASVEQYIFEGTSVHSQVTPWWRKNDYGFESAILGRKSAKVGYNSR